MTLYSITHEHRHGQDTWLVRSAHTPNVPELVVFLGIDYEPDRDEDITINAVNESAILTLWEADDPHGRECAIRTSSAAECTCGKIDTLAAREQGEAV